MGIETNAVTNNVSPIDDFNMMDVAMDIDEEALDAHSPLGEAMEVAHNVSMDGGSSPKKNREIGPIFDSSEFGPAGQAPQVQQSALVSQINQQLQNKPKQMTRQDHAKLIREQKRATFLEKRAQAIQKMEPVATKDNMLRGQLG